MKLLNIGCGSVRPGAPWVNLDNLWSQLKQGTPERTNLDAENNYVEHTLFGEKLLPFTSDTFDGILCSHVIEHADCQQSAALLSDCRRVLKPGGLLVVSVPDAEYFLKVHSQDTPNRAVELFGEPICPDEPYHKSFFDYALFYNQHRQVLTEPSLRCILIRAGFNNDTVRNFYNILISTMTGTTPLSEIEKQMNRRKFSLEMCAVK